MHISFDCDPWTGGVEGSVKNLEELKKKHNLKGTIEKGIFGIATLKSNEETSFTPDQVSKLTKDIKGYYPGKCRGAQWEIYAEVETE